MKNKMKNTLLKKTYIWAVFPLRGPAWAFVGCCGLRGLSWLLSTPKRGVVGVEQTARDIKDGQKNEKYIIKKKHTYGPFSLFVGLRRPSLAAGAFVGFRG